MTSGAVDAIRVRIEASIALIKAVAFLEILAWNTLGAISLAIISALCTTRVAGFHKD